MQNIDQIQSPIMHKRKLEALLSPQRQRLVAVVSPQPHVPDSKEPASKRRKTISGAPEISGISLSSKKSAVGYGRASFSSSVLSAGKRKPFTFTVEKSSGAPMTSKQAQEEIKIKNIFSFVGNSETVKKSFTPIVHKNSSATKAIVQKSGKKVAEANKSISQLASSSSRIPVLVNLAPRSDKKTNSSLNKSTTNSILGKNFKTRILLKKSALDSAVKKLPHPKKKEKKSPSFSVKKATLSNGSKSLVKLNSAGQFSSSSRKKISTGSKTLSQSKSNVGRKSLTGKFRNKVKSKLNVSGRSSTGKRNSSPLATKLSPPLAAGTSGITIPVLTKSSRRSRSESDCFQLVNITPPSFIYSNDTFTRIQNESVIVKPARKSSSAKETGKSDNEKSADKILPGKSRKSVLSEVKLTPSKSRKSEVKPTPNKSGKSELDVKLTPSKSRKSEVKLTPNKSGKSELDVKLTPSKSRKSEVKPTPNKSGKSELDVKLTPSKSRKSEVKLTPNKSGKSELDVKLTPSKSRKSEVKPTPNKSGKSELDVKLTPSKSRKSEVKLTPNKSGKSELEVKPTPNKSRKSVTSEAESIPSTSRKSVLLDVKSSPNKSRKSVSSVVKQTPDKNVGTKTSIVVLSVSKKETSTKRESLRRSIVAKKLTSSKKPVHSKISTPVRQSRGVGLRKSVPAALATGSSPQKSVDRRSLPTSQNQSPPTPGFGKSKHVENIPSEKKVLPVRLARRSLSTSPATSVVGSISNPVSKKDAPEYKAERAAKKLKKETPKSPDKKKMAALLLCHLKKHSSVKKKPLFSDIVKKSNPVAQTAHLVPVISKVGLAVRKPLYHVQRKPLVIGNQVPGGSTGHANSPAPIIIRKKQVKTPVSLRHRKGRKSQTSNVVKSVSNNEQLDGVSSLFKTPKNSSKRASSPSSDNEPICTSSKQKEVLISPLATASARKSIISSVQSSTRKNLKVNFNLSGVSATPRSDTSRPLRSIISVQLGTPFSPKESSNKSVTPSRTFLDALELSVDSLTPKLDDSKKLRTSPRRKESIQKQQSPVKVRMTSPRTVEESERKKSLSRNDNSSSGSSVQQSSPVKDSGGTRKRRSSDNVTPDFVDSPEGRKSRSRTSTSPKSSVEESSKKSSGSYRTPVGSESSPGSTKKQSLLIFSTPETGSSRITRKSVLNDHSLTKSILSSSDKRAEKRQSPNSLTDSTMYSTHDESFFKANKSAKKSRNVSFALEGSTDVNNSFDFSSMQTPDISTSMFVSPMSTLKKGGSARKSITGASGNKTSSPKPSTSRDVSVGEKKMPRSPASSYVNVTGVKRILRTPKSPKSSYLDVGGVKRIFTTPKSPKSSYIDVKGVKKIFKTPQSSKSSYVDVEGVRQILRTPKSAKSNYTNQFFQISPVPDYTDVIGVKRLFGNSNQQSSYLDVTGVRNALKDSRSPSLTGVDFLFASSELQHEIYVEKNVSVKKELIQAASSAVTRTRGKGAVKDLKGRSPKAENVESEAKSASKNSPVPSTSEVGKRKQTGCFRLLTSLVEAQKLSPSSSVVSPPKRRATRRNQISEPQDRSVTPVKLPQTTKAKPSAKRRKVEESSKVDSEEKEVTSDVKSPLKTRSMRNKTNIVKSPDSQSKDGKTSTKPARKTRNTKTTDKSRNKEQDEEVASSGKDSAEDEKLPKSTKRPTKRSKKTNVTDFQPSLISRRGRHKRTTLSESISDKESHRLSASLVVNKKRVQFKPTKVEKPKSPKKTEKSKSAKKRASVSPETKSVSPVKRTRRTTSDVATAGTSGTQKTRTSRSEPEKAVQETPQASSPKKKAVSQKKSQSRKSQAAASKKKSVTPKVKKPRAAASKKKSVTPERKTSPAKKKVASSKQKKTSRTAAETKSQSVEVSPLRTRLRSKK